MTIINHVDLDKVESTEHDTQYKYRRGGSSRFIDFLAIRRNIYSHITVIGSIMSFSISSHQLWINGDPDIKPRVLLMLTFYFQFRCFSGKSCYLEY